MVKLPFVPLNILPPGHSLASERKRKEGKTAYLTREPSSWKLEEKFHIYARPCFNPYKIIASDFFKFFIRYFTFPKIKLTICLFHVLLILKATYTNNEPAILNDYATVWIKEKLESHIPTAMYVAKKPCALLKKSESNSTHINLPDDIIAPGFSSPQYFANFGELTFGPSRISTWSQLQVGEGIAHFSITNTSKLRCTTCSWGTSIIHLQVSLFG